MNKNLIYPFALALGAVAMSSCNDFLDTMPDNRATLDNEEKIKSILVSAYVDHEVAWVNELSSDNCDDYGPNNPNTNRWMDDTFAWKEESEVTNESLSRYWENAYVCIAAANEAIAALQKMENEGQTSLILSELKGEALMCRAFNHFSLANLFCMPWTQNAAQNLGLPYMDHPETELQPQYERGNLADFYEKIQKDLEDGVELVGDSYYQVPKYHFNKKAAYAFATRFYLYTEQWEKAIEYANKCLGSEARAMLRDWNTFKGLPKTDQVQPNAYISTTANCNLLLQTAYSRLGVTFGAYTSNSRYMHGQHLATQEDYRAANMYGTTPTGIYGTYTGSNYDKSLIRKCSYLFEYTDPVAGIGYAHTVLPIFTADECLLNRAEALIMLKRFDEAAADLTLWGQNLVGNSTTLTPTSITNFYNGRAYCYDDADRMQSTMKKHLNPAFAIDAEGSTQECMLQCMLAYRRIETLHHGMRWYDIRRYGIEIPRRVMNAGGVPSYVTDWLGKDDPRRAYQVPQKVRDAGFEPNPR